MKTCEYAGDPVPGRRSHPWTESAENPGWRYYDLTRTAAHIRTSLEDFQPWGRYPAVEAFYVLLERLNLPGSALESNDCAFTGPAPTENPSVAKPFECSGRVMVLYRALARNTLDGEIERLSHRLHCELVNLDRDFAWGVVGTTQMPVRYLGLPEPDGGQLGTQLMISFWAWGDSEVDTMANLGRLFANLSQALGAVAARA